MYPDVHARIQTFLQQQTIIPLIAETDSASAQRMFKAGIVPYIRRDGDYLFYTMKPVPKRPGLGAPLFQLCKGTRMYYTQEEGWRDLQEHQEASQKEPLAATALREGIEELGLKLEALSTLLDVGAYSFASTKTGSNRQMWLFAAPMRSVEDVLPMHDVAATTSARSWLTLEEFLRSGRDDHQPILKDIHHKLSGYYAHAG